jgi:hypothetical protein
MEGKALLFGLLGGVDAVPVCLATKDRDEIVRVVECLAPSFGGVKPEDVAQPKCFGALDRLRERLPIPVWHHDQQGTATVVAAALGRVGKRLEQARIALVGVGAANVAVCRLLRACGTHPSGIVACGRGGALHRGRSDPVVARESSPDTWRICCESNADRVAGGVEAALRGADELAARRTETLTVAVRPARSEGQGAPRSVAEVVATAEPSQKPAGPFVRQVKALDTIEPIDKPAGGGRCATRRRQPFREGARPRRPRPREDRRHRGRDPDRSTPDRSAGALSSGRAGGSRRMASCPTPTAACTTPTPT